MDHCNVHTLNGIKEFMFKKNLKFFFIPKGATSLLQMLDASINKPFKQYFRNLE